MQFLKILKDNINLNYFKISIICIIMILFSLTASKRLGVMTSTIANQNSYNIIVLSLGIIGIYILWGICNTLFKLLCSKVEENIYQFLQLKTLRKIFYLNDINEIGNINKSDIYTLISKDIEECTLFLSETFPNVIFQTIRFTISIIYTFMIEWKIAGCYVLITIITLAFQLLIGNFLKSAAYIIKNQEVEMNEMTQNTLENRELIKLYDCEKWVDILRGKSERSYMNANIKMSMQTMPLQIIGILCGILPIICISILGLQMNITGSVSLKNFMTIFYICQGILPDQLHYCDLWMEAINNIPAQNRLLAFWEKKKTNGEQFYSSLNKEKTGITLQNVKYHYPNTNKWTIKNVSIRIKKGEKVAFIGKSGSGKSTLLKLIAGIIVPQVGIIETASFSYESQTPFLFTDTVKHNILYSRNCCDKEFQKACDANELSSVIIKCNKGLDTILYKNGSQLSGGQRQKIAMARTLNSQKDVLLFDETLSALDVVSACRVMENIINEYKMSTIIFCLHQRELLPYLDKIYIIENGKVVAEGSYEELCKENHIL